MLVTCGHDGHIITWSIDSGLALNTFLNVIEGEGRASVLEASFTSSGEHLLTVDANGHISIFGRKFHLSMFLSMLEQPFDAAFVVSYVDKC